MATTTLDDHLSALRQVDSLHGAVADVLASLTTCGVAVASLIARSAPGVDSAVVGDNASGDTQKALDVQAELLFVEALAGSDVAAVCSEETELAIPVNAGGRLVVALDPIDGSSNIDTNAPIGTIFSILPMLDGDATDSLLQTGRAQLAAGFIVYGPRTVLALTWGEGTFLYCLDPGTGAFVQTHAKVALPIEAQEYAINASNARHWTPSIRAYVNHLVSGSTGPRDRDFNMRWIASLVAETYRILLRGGIYLYPADQREGYGAGRIRLVYEANPIAFLCEQAGGEATNGITAIMDMEPTSLHQRVPFIFGSTSKVARVRRYLLDPPANQEESPLFSQRGLFRT
jgi:fructose-1,6-bisphosphatase I